MYNKVSFDSIHRPWTLFALLNGIDETLWSVIIAVLLTVRFPSSLLNAKAACHIDAKEAKEHMFIVGASICVDRLSTSKHLRPIAGLPRNLPPSVHRDLCHRLTPFQVCIAVITQSNHTSPDTVRAVQSSRIYLRPVRHIIRAKHQLARMLWVISRRGSHHTHSLCASTTAAIPQTKNWLEKRHTAERDCHVRLQP